MDERIDQPGNAFFYLKEGNWLHNTFQMMKFTRFLQANSIPPEELRKAKLEFARMQFTDASMAWWWELAEWLCDTALAEFFGQ